MPCEDLLQLLQQNRTNEKLLLEKLFSCIYTEYHDDYIAWVMYKFSYMDDKEQLKLDAEDSFQEGLLALFIHLQKDGFILTSSLKAYLFRVCLNQLLNIFRRRARDAGEIENPLKWYEADFEILFDAESGRDNIKKLIKDPDDINFDEIGKAVSEDLKDILNKLPQNQRQILILRYLLKWSKQKIAKHLKISEIKIEKAIIDAHRTNFDVMMTEPTTEVSENFLEEQEKQAEEQKSTRCQIEVFVEILRKRKEPVHQQVILLSYFYDMKSGAVAETLEVAVENVYNIKWKFSVDFESLYNIKCKSK